MSFECKECTTDKVTCQLNLAIEVQHHRSPQTWEQPGYSTKGLSAFRLQQDGHHA